MGEVGGEKDITENQPFHSLDAKPAKTRNVFSVSNVTVDTGWGQFSRPGVGYPNSVKKLSEVHMGPRELGFLYLEQSVENFFSSYHYFTTFKKYS